MALGGFLLEAVLVSLSGVMAPGPITSVTVGLGSENPRAGAWVAVGHGLVEIPLMIAVYFGVGAVVDRPGIQAGISLVGGAFLIYLGWGLLRSLRISEVEAGRTDRSPLAAGALLSLGNPYFLIWWATVGAALILRSVSFGWIGFALFAAAHWLCDLIWDTTLGVLSFQGGQFFGRRFQQAAFALSGGFLIFYSLKLLLDAVRLLAS